MAPDVSPSDALKRLFADHARQWRENRYVYPVISRRSRGLSLGINLTQDRRCNFDCIYCNVDRSPPDHDGKVHLDVLEAELTRMLDWSVSGEIFKDLQFADAPKEYQRLNDIAFSGDGEPTADPSFDPAVQLVLNALKQRNLDEVKLILITNGSLLHQPQVIDALNLINEHPNEIWAKLDAGDEASYQRIARCAIPLERIVSNITELAKQRPVIIQSLMLNHDGQPPTEYEITRYVDRLTEITSAGGQLHHVQLYTVARQTAEANVGPLTVDQLNHIAGRVHEQLPDLEVRTYPGVS